MHLKVGNKGTVPKELRRFGIALDGTCRNYGMEVLDLVAHCRDVVTS